MVMLLPSGRLQRQVLLLLLDEGQLSVNQMSEQLDAQNASLHNSLRELLAADLLTQANLPSISSRPPGRMVRHYGLNARGIEAALCLETLRAQEREEERLMDVAAKELF